MAYSPKVLRGLSRYEVEMEIAARVLAYLASVGVVAGLVFAAIAFGARAKAMRASGWRTVVGQVVRPPRFAWFGPLGGGLRYRYEIDGTAYEAGRVRLMDWPALLWPDAGTVRAGLAAKTLNVQVNPALAEDAALDLSPPPRSFGWAGVGLTITCLLFLGARRLF